MKLTSPKRVKEILDKYDFKVKKNLGQNFIVDENILNGIINAAGLQYHDTVLEIGPGIGTLTKALAEIVENVIAIELDRDIIEILNGTLLREYDNIILVQDDALKIEYDELLALYLKDQKKVKVVANLPYYITTPLLMKLATSSKRVKDLVLTVQKEAAQRLMAKVGTKEYSAVTVILNYYYNIELVMKLTPNVFLPPPKVDSAVIKLEKHLESPVYLEDEELFIEFVKKSFAKRRKTLKNNLKDLALITQEDFSKILDEHDLDSMVRAQDLELFTFASIFNVFYNRYGASFIKS